MWAVAPAHPDRAIAYLCLLVQSHREASNRKLKQDQIHLHPWAEDLPTLRQQILRFCQPFEAGSTELLSCVGLHLPY